MHAQKIRSLQAQATRLASHVSTPAPLARSFQETVLLPQTKSASTALAVNSRYNPKLPIVLTPYKAFTAPTGCAACKEECGSSEYLTAGCTLTSDTQCASCSVCGETTFEAQACTNLTDTVYYYSWPMLIPVIGLYSL